MRCAADPNFFISLATRHDTSLDALAVLRREAPRLECLVPVTVATELSYLANEVPDPQLATLAQTALASLAAPWGFQLGLLSPSESQAAAFIAAEMFRAEILPAAERNDARIVAECALLGCLFVVSDDSHLRFLDKIAPDRILAPHSLASPVIVSARELVRLFFR
jgi:hypothetical protein